MLLLSRDKAYSVRSALTVAAITRTIRNIPVEVALGPPEGLPQPCVVNLDEILTIPKILLKSRVTVLSKDKLSQVDQAICFALDLRLQ